MVKHEDFLEAHSYEYASNRGYKDGVMPDYEDLTWVTYKMTPQTLLFEVHGPDVKQLATELQRELGGRWEKGPPARPHIICQRERDKNGGQIRIDTEL